MRVHHLNPLDKKLGIFSSLLVLLDLQFKCLHDKCNFGFILCLHLANRGNKGETNQGNHNQI